MNGPIHFEGSDFRFSRSHSHTYTSSFPPSLPTQINQSDSQSEQNFFLISLAATIITTPISSISQNPHVVNPIQSMSMSMSMSMEDYFFRCKNGAIPTFLPKSYYYYYYYSISGGRSSSSSSHNSFLVRCSRILSPRILQTSSISLLPPEQRHSSSSRTPRLPPLPPPPLSTVPPDPLQFDPHSEFGVKMLYLESIGVDLFSLIDEYPSIVSSTSASSLEDVKSTVDFIRSMGFSTLDFRRICFMCPEILNYKSSDVIPVFTFLLREAKVNSSDLRKVINRRPRLLVSDVVKRLRPTLYFLQSIGIAEVARHTYLLSCSVEDKFVPRIEYLEKIGFSYRDAISMVRRFPRIFCYSIKENLEPKFDYFMVEMGRELKELKEFPQYFSFSLENRIKPRHQCCVEKGVCFPVHVMLKCSEAEFGDKLEVCRSSSPPLRSSPLWCTNSSSSSSSYNDSIPS